MEKSCIVCDKSLEECLGSSGDAECIGALNDATIWRSHGNYGSTLYDPMGGGEFLEAYVCDECLKRKGSQVRAVEYRRGPSISTFDDSFDAMEAARTDQLSRSKPCDSRTKSTNWSKKPTS